MRQRLHTVETAILPLCLRLEPRMDTNWHEWRGGCTLMVRNVERRTSKFEGTLGISNRLRFGGENAYL